MGDRFQPGAALGNLAMTYTSLGLGDIFPLGRLRMVVGVEALTGLLMISLTPTTAAM